MSRGLEFTLRAWGEFRIKHKDHADEYGENILYAAGLLQGRVQDASSSGSKILCPDTPSHIQAVDIAVNKLPFAQKRAIIGWYCEPLKEDGNPPTKAQTAMKLRTSKSSFELSLGKAKRNLQYIVS